MQKLKNTIDLLKKNQRSQQAVVVAASVATLVASGAEVDIGGVKTGEEPGDDTGGGSADDNKLEAVGVVSGSATKGTDNIVAGDQGSTIGAGQSSDIITGGAGIDMIKGGDGDDSINGKAGNDILYGNDGNDNIYGDAGDDVMDGGKGDDTIQGVDGDDVITGGEGNDYLSGNAGTDDVDGGAGNDEVAGGEGNDNLKGGAGDDDVRGQQGNDTLDGGSGENEINGGSGVDTLVINAASIVYDVNKGTNKIDISYMEQNIASVDHVKGIERIQLADNAPLIDVKDIWSDLSTADQAEFSDVEANFLSWLTNDYNYAG